MSTAKPRQAAHPLVDAALPAGPSLATLARLEGTVDMLVKMLIGRERPTSGDAGWRAAACLRSSKSKQ